MSWIVVSLLIARCETPNWFYWETRIIATLFIGQHFNCTRALTTTPRRQDPGFLPLRPPRALLTERERPLQRSVVGGSSDQDRELSWIRPPLSAWDVVVGKRAPIQRQHHALGFPRLQVHLGESLQLLDRTGQAGMRVNNVHFCHFSTFTLAAVAHIEQHGNGLAQIAGLRCHG